MDWKHSSGSRRISAIRQVIILTAHDSLNNAIESIKRGAFHFISKPYAPEELLSLVEQALEKRSLCKRRRRCAKKPSNWRSGWSWRRRGSPRFQKQSDAGNGGVDRRDGAIGRERAYHRREAVSVRKWSRM